MIRTILSRTNRQLNTTIQELHARSVSEKNRAETATEELEHLRTVAAATRRRDHEIRALLSRLTLGADGDHPETRDLGAAVLALLDGPPPSGPCSIFCPACGVADVEELDVPIPHTDDTTPVARCRRCGHSWGLDPGAGRGCLACGGSGNLRNQRVTDPRCTTCYPHD
ncbi:hypothetical protein ACJ6WD_35585 [Streptomyces sp. VTCC 41912]|uniref:hypothetical protein n=1 Tax=Streptomyces sp. VTCC 41912 TaxID=3383243 RepID=UPI0038968353